MKFILMICRSIFDQYDYPQLRKEFETLLNKNSGHINHLFGQIDLDEINQICI